MLKQMLPCIFDMVAGVYYSELMDKMTEKIYSKNP